MADFDDVIHALNNIPQAIDSATERGLKKAAMIVVRTAKGKLGKYQPASGQYPAWEQLKPMTVRRKYARNTEAGQKYIIKHGSWGNGGKDDAPLIDSGQLRLAITTDTSDIANGTVYVGVASGDENQKGTNPGIYAAAHEFGLAASNVPPRPFLRPAVYENQEAIKEAIKEELRDGVLDIWK